VPREPGEISDATFQLLLAEGIGPITLAKLRERFGTDDHIVSAGIKDFEQVRGIGPAAAQAIRRGIDNADIDAERRAMAERSAKLILHADGDYPPLLAMIADPPSALWIRGQLSTDDRLAIALVGSRKCSAYGREQAGRFAVLLAQSGLTIVSGGAAGIDGEAHRGALRVNGRTIVVTGCGLSTAYPAEHAALFDRIAESGSGAVVSEFPMGAPPSAGNFPRRNRIISGMSLGVLVIEAALRSGALITARLAVEEHHREVMALPGRVDSPTSAGCLKAIKEGWAALVIDHADVLSQLDSSHQLVRGAVQATGNVEAKTTTTLFDGSLSDGQRLILNALQDEGDQLLMDQIAARTHLPLSQIMADITLLQIRGMLLKDFGGGVRLKNKSAAATSSSHDHHD
jgi:DNA processing protein